MDLKEARENYYFHTGKAGDVGRQLALGGIAVVWLLHGGPSPTLLVFPKALLIALGCFLLSLAFDFFQYFVSAMIWGVYSRHKETHFQENGIEPVGAEFSVPRITNWWAIFCFLGKSVFLIGGGMYLGCYILVKVHA